MKTVNINNVLWNAQLPEELSKISNRGLTKLGDVKCNDFYVTSQIRILDDIWDMNSANTNYRSSKYYMFDFSDIENRYKFYIKMVIITELMFKENEARTVNSLFYTIKKFAKYLSDNLIWHGELINVRLIERYLEGKKQSISQNHFERIAYWIGCLLVEIEKAHPTLNYIHIYGYLSSVNDAETSKAETRNNKTNYIPFKIYNKIVACAIKDMKDNSLDIKKRMDACLIVILAETGIRVEELVMIERNKLDSYTLKNGKKVSFLNYTTFKTGTRETITFITNKAECAYNTLVALNDRLYSELDSAQKMRLLIKIHSRDTTFGRVSMKKTKRLFEQIPSEKISELEYESKRFLYVSPNSLAKKYEDGTSAFRLGLKQFFLRHRNTFKFEELDYKSLSKMKEKVIDNKGETLHFFRILDLEHPHECLGVKFYYASPHMFRVTVCTKLFRNGVHLDFIMKHMNHLVPEMTEHYNRSKEFKNKVVEGIYILQRIATKDGLLEINPEMVKDEKIKKELIDSATKRDYHLINKFLEANKLNILRDVDTLIKMVRKFNSPIFDSELGVCAKVAIHGICERQLYFNSTDDNYFVGIKIPCIEFANYTYERFKEKAKIVSYNKEVAEKNPKYLNEYTREKNALKSYINKKVHPELVLIKEKIEQISLFKFIDDNPKLKNIALNIDKILREEVIPWMN